MGPKPSIGRRLKHVVEIYGKGKVGRHHAYLDTRDGMVAVVTSYHPIEDDADDDIEGISTTGAAPNIKATTVIELDDEFSKHVELKMSPREFCERIDSRALNPNKDIIISSTKETLGKAKERGACTRIENEFSREIPVGTNGDGPSCTSGPQFREFERVYFQYELPESEQRSPMQQNMSNLDDWKKGKYERTYCYMNTLTAKIVECSLVHASDLNSWKFPKDIISSYKTSTSNPNVEIIVEETNEQLGNARLRGAIKSLDAESNFDGVRKKEYKLTENADGLKSSGTSSSSNLGAKSTGKRSPRA